MKIQLSGTKLVAQATDGYLTPTHPFPDTTHLPTSVATPTYGQDITFGVGRAAPQGHDVGSTTAVLEPKMRNLVYEFASNDTTGMASRLMTLFLAKQSSVKYFDDPSLNAAAAGHSNITFFMSAALSAPTSPFRSAGKTRIHQALRNANWDINRIVAPTDLGVPAFNDGNKLLSTGDFGNGLGLMINGVQRVYVIAEDYQYDSELGMYSIALKFVFYDVFGLDDDDLVEYGAMTDRFYNTDKAVGITAWWQLQHTHGYAPLVTRIVIRQRHAAIPAV